MRQLVLLYGILVSSICAWSASEIESVKTKIAGKEFTAVYSVTEPIEEKDLKINYRPRSVELVFSGTTLGEKSIVRVEHPLVDRVYSAKKDGKVFSRVIFKEGLVAKDYENKIGFEVKDNKVFLKLSEKEVFPVAAAADLDSALDKEVAKILSQDMPEKVATKSGEDKIIVLDKDGAKKESEIPVLTKKEVKKSESESPYGRLLMSFFVIAIFGAAFAMMGRWWKKRASKNTDNNKIRMVTQHFLGPKKSLAIVRVAGETILIGVTDHNINMIKSLSLIDDEDMDNIDPTKSFGDILQNAEPAARIPEEVVEEEEEEDFSFKQIKDRISNRVKEMRPL